MYPRSGPPSYRDRTLEFFTVAERLKKSFSSVSNADAGGGGGGGGTRLDGSKSTAIAQSEFNRRAAKIGRGIHDTSTKLSKLAILAKSTSTFSDPTAEIQQLTGKIKREIGVLNSEVVDLQILCNSQNESGNTSGDISSHSTTVVDDLKNRLMSATKEFKEVLTKRTENLKAHENRHQLFSSKKDTTNPFMRQRPLVSRGTTDSATAPLIPSWAASPASSQAFASNPLNGEASTSSQPSMQQQQQQQQIVPMQDSYMHSRAEALQNVESTIHELSNIFTQLASMVSQQGELAIRIDENMDDTLANVEGAQGALLKYLNGISSNRWLMIKIFFVLMVFLLIFVFFVA